MSTRSDALNRVQQGNDARARVLSGIYNQPAASVSTTYVSSRARALSQFNEQQEQQRRQIGDELMQMSGPVAIKERLKQLSTPSTTPAASSTETPEQKWLKKENATVDSMHAPTILKKFAKTLNGLQVNTKIGRFLNQFSQSAAQATGIDTQAIGNAPMSSTGSKAADKVARIGGLLAGSSVNPAQLEASVATGGQQLATGLAQKYLPKAGAFAQRAVGAALEGAAQNTAVNAAAGRTDPGELASAAAFGAAGGAVFEGASTLLGKAVSRFMNRKPVPVPAAEEAGQLALPGGTVDQLRLPAPRERGNANRAETPDVITEPYTFGLPEPQVGAPTKARVQRMSGLPKVLEEIKPIVDERMTPPLENVNELAKWVKGHLGDDVSLNEVRRLPYEDLRQLAEEMRKRITVYDTAVQAAAERGHDLPKLLKGKRQIDWGGVERGRESLRMRDVAGAPPLVKSMADRYPQGMVSPAAGIQTTPGRAPGLRPMRPKPEPVEAAQPVIEQPKPEPTMAASPQPQKAAEPPASPYGKMPEPDENWDGTIPFDVGDDLEVHLAEEVAPRVRDRVSSYADDLIASARAELSKNRNRLSSNPADVYGQYAKIMAGHMLKGTVKLADLAEQMVKDFGEEIRPHVRAIFKQAKEQYKVMRASIEAEELGLSGFGSQELKDLSNLNLNTADVYRNFRKVFADQYGPVKAAILDPFDKSKGEYAQLQKDLTDKLYSEVVQGLGIKKGSKESALVQKYGEKQITLDQLQEQAPQGWKNIVKADAWFRREYDTLIDQVNGTVSRIYPNRPEKLVPKRADYYRHFQEMNAWSGLKNLFDTTSGKISPSLSGLSPFTQPKTKWASFKQKRGMGEFKNDAVGGFLEYIPAASYAINIDPHIAVFRNLAKRLAGDTEQTANINNFIKFLNNFANDLSGKTSPVDRWVEEVGGRKALQILTKVNNRVKSNVILGNVRSTLSQLANIPTGIAYGGVDAPAGALKTLESIWQPNEAMAKSAFLKERYLDKSFRRFDTKVLQQPKRFAEWMMETSDRVGTSFVWNSAYAKGLRQKVPNPVKFADENTRRLVGGRGVGEQPLLIKSKMFNLVAPFQLEVNNLWRVMKDFTDEKRFGALATLFAANWLLNKAFEKTTGSGVVFDPIDAIVDATTEDQSFLKRTGRIGGEMLSNLPFGQTLASLYPENGANYFGAELPRREDFFGDKDPTRFGSGLLAAGAISDPLFKFALPFGGNQLKKTAQGADALARGGVFTENFLTTGKEIEERKLKYPVKPTAANIGRALAFSPNATDEGQNYNNNDLRPLSEKQTRAFERSADPEANYEKLQRKRTLEAAKAKMAEIRKDKSLSQAQKDKKISKLKESIAK
ncbi:hypothetical protein [Paenibacillus humicus]|uniref:hypothetical protein n=1 Tax=Paenibacillus humicus TaxID=412861 RepID=UPI003F184998